VRSHVDRGYTAKSMTPTVGVSGAGRVGSKGVKIHGFPDVGGDQLTRSAREDVRTTEVISFLPFRVMLFRDTLLPGSNSKWDLFQVRSPSNPGAPVGGEYG